MIQKAKAEPKGIPPKVLLRLLYNETLVKIGDRCVDFYTYDVRNLGQDRRSRTRLAKANGYPINRLKSLDFNRERSDFVRSSLLCHALGYTDLK